MNMKSCKIIRTKKEIASEKKILNIIEEYYKQIYMDNIIFNNGSVTTYLQESKEDKITRLENEIDIRQKELNGLKFDKKFKKLLD